MRFYLSFLLIALLAACGAAPQNSDQASATTPPSLQGSVDITHPISGTIIYADALFLRGTADNVPSDGFRLIVLTPDDSILTETVVQPENGEWQVELVHDHSGDPIEATLVALALDPNIVEDYDIESVVIAPSDLRPEGTFGEIIAPAPDSAVGGDQLQVIGRGSGFFENTVLLHLEQPDGTLISETIVTLFNPYFIDDVIYEADVPINGYTGDAVLRMVYTDAQDGQLVEVDRAAITISGAAG